MLNGDHCGAGPSQAGRSDVGRGGAGRGGEAAVWGRDYVSQAQVWASCVEWGAGSAGPALWGSQRWDWAQGQGCEGGGQTGLGACSEGVHRARGVGIARTHQKLCGMLVVW